MTIDFGSPIRDWMDTTIYVAHRSGIPDVVLGRLPAQLAVGRRYKSWICETRQELRAVQTALSNPVPRQGLGLDFRRGPDAAVSGPPKGMEPHGQIVVAVYPPPSNGWPWLILLCVPGQRDAERGIYSWEAMPTEEEAMAHLARMAKMAPALKHVILPPEIRH